jgi:spore maturation protein CgeB
VGAATFASDVVFVGGADKDRIPYITALIEAGFKVALYGGYWTRHSETRGLARGHADPQTMRLALGCAALALCLVRHSNRDGHCMRTFEIPAVGGCPLMEDTEEHREMFGAEGEAALYFRSIPEMIEKVRWGLSHPEGTKRLATAAHLLITRGRNTYRDRLREIVQSAYEMGASKVELQNERSR